MSEKRKDSKGRLLRTGETQRPNGTYAYRYSDLNDKRQTIYAKTLDQLRQKENEIIGLLTNGISYTAGNETFASYAECCFETKTNLRMSSLKTIRSSIRKVEMAHFYNWKLKDIKTSDIKIWITELQKQGLKTSTIKNVSSIVRQVFNSAVEDDILIKSPFKSSIFKLLPREPRKEALMGEDRIKFFDFVLKYDKKRRYYYDLVILIGTGMRVAELYGLTKRDLDFKKRTINVNKQMCVLSKDQIIFTQPKTNSGSRILPMSDAVYTAFKMVLQQSNPTDEFVFYNMRGKPKIPNNLQEFLAYIRTKLTKMYGDDFPKVTPHTFRHSFCTDMIMSGLDIKSVQYLMGHSTAQVTLDIYSHATKESAIERYRMVQGNIKSMEQQFTPKFTPFDCRVMQS